MKVLVKTKEFDQWLKRLKDQRAKAKILFRLQKLQNDGHFGSFRSLGGGLFELKINYAQGYRIYFREQDDLIILLLIGGNKTSQKRDIKRAISIWKSLRGEEDEDN